MEKPLTLRIERKTRPKASEPVRSYWQEFNVTLSDEAYVLDALEQAWIQDPTLLFRHSCHHASCGSCGLRVWGRERLSCITPAFRMARGGVLRLEPLRNFPVVGDLVVDMGALAQKLDRVWAPVVVQDEASSRFANCIECGLCVSACPISAVNRDFLGPAPLAAALGSLDIPEVRAQVDDRDGVWRCHGAYECTEVCPSGVEPASAIGSLRKNLITSTIKRKAKSDEYTSL